MRYNAKSFVGLFTCAWAEHVFGHQVTPTWRKVIRTINLITGKSGHNVHIHEMDGHKVGNRVANYKWSEGWTSVKFFSTGGQLHLFLLKKVGKGKYGTVHIHQMDGYRVS